MLPDLTTADGRASFEAALTRAGLVVEPDPVRRASALRSVLDADLATAVLAQEDLRARARDKFGPRAAELYFTPAGLEQSSRTEVAAHRARRFADAGRTSVLDLCCGIGGDLIAFADQGLAVDAVDLDPTTVDIARANVASLGLPAVGVTLGSAEETRWQQAESVFCDPARRSARGRLFDPDSFSPGFGFVTELLTTHHHAAVKLAPGLEHRLVPEQVEAEWVSFSGSVKEAVLWSRGFARARHRATLLPSGAQLTDADPEDRSIGGIGAYVYEPDGAVIRAGLVRQVAALIPGGRRLDENIAYLTGDSATETPFARGYSVIDVVPYSVKRLKNELRARDVGIVEIKKRGVDIDPAILRRQLAPKGSQSMTVLLARVGDDRVAILAHPL